MTEKEALIHDDVTWERIGGGNKASEQITPDLIYKEDFVRAKTSFSYLIRSLESVLGSRGLRKDYRFIDHHYVSTIFKKAYDDEFEKLSQKKKKPTVSG